MDEKYTEKKKKMYYEPRQRFKSRHAMPSYPLPPSPSVLARATPLTLAFAGVVKGRVSSRIVR